jgi:glycosyltransferase involved in cell wall biosynthesis
MNIIITAPSLNPKLNVSGISSVAQFIIKKNKAHHYIHFQIGKTDEENGGIVRILSILGSYFKWLYLLLTTSDKIVHYNFPLDTKAILRDCPLIILTRLMNVKLLIHIHGGAFIQRDDIPNWAQLFLKITLNGKNPILVLGDTEKENLIEKFGCKNVFVLPNSIDLDDATSFSRKPFTINNHLKFLFLGRISKPKGLEYIYLAFKELKKNHQIDFKFYLAGKGEDEKEYVEKFNHLLGDDFIFKGVVFGTQKEDLLKETNIFLLPSFYEGLPISLLEAMAYAQVPICTNVGSIKYIVEDNINGLFIGVKSKDDIVYKILKVQNDISKINVLGLKAKETVFNKYNPDAYIQNLNSYYNYE